MNHQIKPNQSRIMVGKKVTFREIKAIEIDPENQKGAVILTNGVQTYWYDKAGLNHLRRTMGEAIWKI